MPEVTCSVTQRTHGEIETLVTHLQTEEEGEKISSLECPPLYNTWCSVNVYDYKINRGSIFLSVDSLSAKKAHGSLGLLHLTTINEWNF